MSEINIKVRLEELNGEFHADIDFPNFTCHLASDSVKYLMELVTNRLEAFYGKDKPE